MDMTNIAKIGELPTADLNKISLSKSVSIHFINEFYLRNQLLSNFLILKSCEHKKPKSNKTKNLLFQNIINKFNNKNHGDKNNYKYQTGSKVYNDDLKQEALLILWVATEKYLKSKDKNNIPYIKKFESFNDFAIPYLNYKLQELVYKNNTSQLFGKINDNTQTRKEFYCSTNKKNNFFTNKVFSLDEKINNSDFLLKDTIEDYENSINNKDNKLSKFIIEKNLKEITNKYISELNPIKKEILINKIANNFFDKKDEVKTLKFFSQKYNLSLERIRQIANEEFDIYSKYIKKNLNIKNLSISEIYDN